MIFWGWLVTKASKVLKDQATLARNNLELRREVAQLKLERWQLRLQLDKANETREAVLKEIESLHGDLVESGKLKPFKR